MPNDLVIRLLVFLGVFVLLACLENFRPRRPAPLTRLQRWPGAGILFVTGAAVSRLLAPAGLAGIALWADAQAIGLFNIVTWPAWLTGLLAFMILDLAVWGQHVAMHRFPLLWRMHRVHHADPHVDVITALRFHPAEILVSLAWKAAVVVVFGIPGWAAFAFEVALNAFAQFNHANWALSGRADALLRCVVVTPDMHRVHHSDDHSESNRNFGFCLSVWDRLFRLYKAQPEAGHDDMVIGQRVWREAEDQAPLALLAQPLSKTPYSAS